MGESNREPSAPPPTIVASELHKNSTTTTLSELAVELDLTSSASRYANQIDSIMMNWRASCYLSAAQIFLQGNSLANSEIKVEDIKPRLLGHWGTTGGLAAFFTQTSALISRRAAPSDRFLFVVGPGHGAPVILAELYIEGSLTHFYPEYDISEAGADRFVKAFSWPGGLPSHLNSTTPGTIHEGGELGYALSVAYGSVFDSPDLITVVVVGDGESETAATATAFSLCDKFLDSAESGAVIPILHVNGFKISERTVPGTMDNTELSLLYSGHVRIVEYADGAEYHMGGQDPQDRDFHLNLATSMDWAYDEIRKIQMAARSGKPFDKPRWPMIIARSPKCWTGPSRVGGQSSLQLLNNWGSHQVPLPLARTDMNQLALLNRWLASYEPDKIFVDPALNNGSIFAPLVTSILPHNLEQRLGRTSNSYDNYAPLKLSDWKVFGHKKGEEISQMKAIGTYLTDVIKKNPSTFRIFSPDELSSNKLDAVFDVTTRNFQYDPATAHRGGRVIEMLSEHTLQGLYQGYVLTGRHGVFPSYEAFLPIVSSMLTQFSKFAKIAAETQWRKDVASLNYIETSTWTRQEHNGFSHAAVSFIATVLALPTQNARVYFPADANTASSIIAHCLRSKNLVNLIVGTKSITPVYLSIEEAEAHCIAGASVWEKYSTDGGVNPDIVLVGIGVELTEELIACAGELRKDFPDLRVRVINVVDLLIFAPVGSVLIHSDYNLHADKGE